MDNDDIAAILGNVDKFVGLNARALIDGKPRSADVIAGSSGLTTLTTRVPQRPPGPTPVDSSP